MRARLVPAVRRWWPEVAAALAPILVFWPLVAGIRVLYWGLPALQFVPWRVLANDALRQGHLPLWTPLLGMGAPLMANHQSAVFYPPNWIALVLPPEVAVSLLAVLHLSFAGVGMVRLARRIGLGEFGAAVSGLAFCLCGYLTGRMWFITINNALAWLPWIVLCVTPAAPDPAAVINGSGGGGGAGGEARSAIRRLLVLAGLLSLQIVSGHAQSAFYTLLIAGAWTAWHALFPAERRPLLVNLKLLISDLAFLALAVLFAAALTAVQLLPTYELLQQSPRADAAAFDFAMTFSLWPWRLLTFVVPDLFGHPADHDYWGYATYWEDNTYLGLLPLVFALYALLRLRVRSDPAPLRAVVVFSLLMLLASILLAFGKNTPVFLFFYRYVPGFDLFQAPARLLIAYTFAACLLAGVGAHLWAASARKRYWSRLGIAGSVTMTLLGLAGRFAVADPKLRTFPAALTWTGGLAAIAFLILLRQPQTPARWNWVALAFILFDLGYAGLRATPLAGRALYQQPAVQAGAGRLFHYADDEYDVKFSHFFRFKSFDPLDPRALRESLLPNLPVLDGIALANNFDPLVSARHAGYLRVMETSSPLMDLAYVQVIVRPVGALAMRPEPVRRERVVYEAQTVDGPQAALDRITAPGFDPDSRVILEPGPPDSPAGLALDPNRYSTTVTLDRPGYLVLSDTAYPGWRAYVDGAPQPVLTANYNFRAVAVPSGTHRVTFEYAPLSVTLGLAISLGAVLLWAALFAGVRR